MACVAVCLAPNGRVAFIELKSASGRVSENQSEWLDRLACMGFAAGVVRSVDEGVAFLRFHGFPVMERAA